MESLPVYLTRFVGRSRERTELRRLLAAERLVTLFGVGGVGKTRLAADVVAHIGDHYRDGVCFVALDELQDGILLSQHIAEALDIRELQAQSSSEALATALANREMLVVLDSCEHVWQAVATQVQQILHAAPNVRVLITSRQALGVSGENVFYLDPLDTPEQVDPHLHDLHSVDSVALFVDRVRSVAPSFELNDSTEGGVAALCAHLDGIPLAIELAAARMSVLSIDDLLDRLNDRFQILRKSDPGAPERHQTLLALIDWSYDLCAPQERILWSRLSIFTGTFGLDAIEGICRLDDETGAVIFEAISSLVDKGILVRDHGAGRTRYRMLETLRRYGEDLLGDEAASLRGRYLDWYVTLARDAKQQWLTGSQADWITCLRQEYGNIRSALELSSRTGSDAEKGIDMVLSMRVFWMTAGYLGEGRHWLQRLQAVPGVDETARGFALMLDAWFAVYEGRTTEAAPLIMEASDIAAKGNNADLQAWTRYIHALRQLFIGEFRTAGTAFQDAESLFEHRGDKAGVLLCLVQGSLVATACDDSETAIQLCERALDGLENQAEGWFRSYILWAYGVARWQRSEYSTARELEHRSIAIKGEFGEKFGIALSLEVLSWIEAASGSHERAATLLGLLDTMFHTFGVRLAGFKHLIDHHDAAVAQTRAGLPEAKFEGAIRKGNLLGLEGGVKFALGLPTAADARPHALGLTPREIEVSGLVALGLSNREIASRLVLSVRTAEAHIQHILTKMGFTSRAQIASWYTASVRPTRSENDPVQEHG